MHPFGCAAGSSFRHSPRFLRPLSNSVRWVFPSTASSRGVALINPTLPVPGLRSSTRSAYPQTSNGLIEPSSSLVSPLAYRLVLSTSLPRVSETTTSTHGSLAPGGFCCPSHPRYYDPIRQSRRLPRTSQGRWLYRGSVPDDPVWAAAETFPALPQRSFPPCHHPYAERRNRDTPATSLLPKAFRNKTMRQLLYLPRHQLQSGICLRRYSVRVMVRPARLLALLDWSDLESSSSRRGRI